MTGRKPPPLEEPERYPPALALLDQMLRGTPLGTTIRLLVTRYPGKVDYEELHAVHVGTWGARRRTFQRLGANLTNLSNRLRGTGWRVERRTWFRGTRLQGMAWLAWRPPHGP